MLRSIVIGPDEGFGEILENFLQGFGRVTVLRRVAGYPDTLNLVRIVRAHAPHIVFLGLDAVAQAWEIVATLERETPGVQIVGTHRSCDPQLLLDAMRMGVREFVTLPLTPAAFGELLARLEQNLERCPPEHGATDRVYAFLPAKAGVGCSTVALNASVMVSKLPDVRTLLVDLDLSSGILRFLLKLDNSYCIADACEKADSLDEILWPQLVCRYGSLDLLHSGGVNPHLRIEGIQIRYLMDFVRRQYEVVCADLSGNLERYSAEIMQEAKTVFLVTTAELAALHLAKEKLKFLHSIDVVDRVSLVINRAQKRGQVPVKDIESLLGAPVAAVFPNDYTAVQRATQDGKAVDGASELGKRFKEFAKTLAPPAEAEADTPAKKRLGGLLSFSIFGENRSPATN